MGRATRTIPRRLRRALQRRDGGCRFPGCTATRWVDAHHVVFWSEGGPTELDNLVLLCRHHHRLVHEVGYRVTAHGDQRFTFHRPDGTLIPAAAAPHRGDADAPARANSDAGLDITADSPIPDWDGSPPDFDLTATVLQNTAWGPRAADDGDSDAVWEEDDPGALDAELARWIAEARAERDRGDADEGLPPDFFER